MFHLAFRPVVDCISCSVLPFPLHVISFSLKSKSGGFLLCDEVEVCSLSKDSVMPHNLKDDQDDRLCHGVNVVFLTTPTRSVDPFPLKKKRWERGCDSGGAPSGVLPFPSSKNQTKEKNIKKKKRERGRTRRTIYMAFALTALDCFSSDTTGCYSLTHVHYILSHTSHFPALGKPKKKTGTKWEWRIYTSGAACPHSRTCTRNLG